MRVCLICAELFGWGTRGGFGYATRVVGRELVKQGVEVYAVVPRPVTDGDYGRAITELLAGGAWRARGHAGFDYVKERNDLERAAALHIAEYRRHLPHRD